MLDIVVIGGGQAGLSAAYHLSRRGLVPERDFIVLDANPGPGGAWRHRWPTLTLGAAHSIHDLPGMPLTSPDPSEPAAAVVERYYGGYEKEFGLPVHRPVRVQQVTSAGGGLPNSGELPLLRVGTDRGSWRTRLVINGTGTWDRPYWPHYPGRELFRGRELHTHDFCSVDDFRGQRVLVVGGGTSAVQFLLQLAGAGVQTAWSTRRPPEFTERPFDQEWGREVEKRVRERTARGLPPGSVVSVTALPLTPVYRQGIADGILVSRGPLASITADGVQFADGSTFAADAILWATGFRASLDHLAPLKLREPGGGIIVEDGVRVAKDPRVFLVGYGPSASTLGATRAGRAAALAAIEALGVPAL
ncbi:FAD-dependent oxidoreductase [Paenarthrobacter sp. Z7-10]|nr:FAD-dependent oxidoreductase [Paenarthrobacter sp. Z7-10]